MKFDRWGRLQYDPDLHPNHAKPWTVKEEQYLIDFYGGVSPEELSLSLGRTPHAVYQKATMLRKQGRLKKIGKNFKRLLREEVGSDD